MSDGVTRLTIKRDGAEIDVGYAFINGSGDLVILVSDQETQKKFLKVLTGEVK